ncbi:hypothetical protein Fmac_019317 [Flemingia macrophylla]|uniref:Uncharacterized protein n=1 Tax=Flemingia macrophylla TaxID=520843 RepID=A0ABD1M7H4_9FABA
MHGQEGSAGKTFAIFRHFSGESAASPYLCLLLLHNALSNTKTLADGKRLSRSVQRALFFSSRILRSLSCEFPCGEFKTFLALSIPSLEPRRKPPSPSDSISLLTLYMWAPDIYEGSPTPLIISTYQFR